MAEGSDNKSPLNEDDPRNDAKFYCPGCGRAYDYQTQCVGLSASAPHAPIAVVETKELSGKPEDHTPAPNTGER